MRNLVLACAGLAAIAFSVLLAFELGWWTKAPAPTQKDPSIRQISSVVLHEHRILVQRPAASTTEDEPPPAPAMAVEEDPAPVTEDEIAVKLEGLYEEDLPATPDSRGRENSLRSAFEQPDVQGAHVRSVECKATRCRMEVDFDSHEADVRVLKDVLVHSRRVSLKATIPVRTQNEDGSVSAVIYFQPPKRRSSG